MSYKLRKLEIKDAIRMQEWMNDDAVVKYLRIKGKGKDINVIKKFILDSQNDEYNKHYAIVDKNDTYLGTVSLKNIDNIKGEAEYAIALHQEAIGKGVATVATKLILVLAFDELNLNSIYLNVLCENKRAINFYKKFGFRNTSTTFIDFEGNEKKLIWFGIDKSSNSI